ncbi:MAG: hypothetical protein JSR77_11875 [Planctomycetes bacterium]|nr:hypothetical protein [Planctomycetota bacterium]
MQNSACWLAMWSLSCVTSTLAQITVPPGWAVDQLVGRLDNKTPRIEAIRNAAFGTGVVAASVNSGILTVRRLTGAGQSVVATTTVSGSNPSVLDLRFDTTGGFGGDLFVSVESDFGGSRADLFRVSSTGAIANVATWATGDIGFTLDFTPAAHGWMAGAYLYDLNGPPTEYWFLSPAMTRTQLSANTVPPSRTDTDVRGAEFDRTGVFGFQFVLCDNDANNSGINAVYGLNAAGVWSTIVPPVPSNVRYYRDLAISTGGALGQALFLLDAVQDRVYQSDAQGNLSVFASGFTVAAQYDAESDGAPSLSVSDDGNTMYVADTNGVYRIRLLGSAPGPTILMREPSLPPGAEAFSNPQGVPFVRVLWSSAIAFSGGDLTVTRASDGHAVPFAVSGSGSQFMLISFGAPLLNDEYTITIHDTVRSLAGVPIDGDANGINGGNAVLTYTHHVCTPNECPTDFNQDGGIDGSDVQAFFDLWESGSCQ